MRSPPNLPALIALLEYYHCSDSPELVWELDVLDSVGFKVRSLALLYSRSRFGVSRPQVESVSGGVSCCDWR